MNFAPDFPILAKAYRIPLQCPVVVVRCFWLFALLFEAANQTFTAFSWGAGGSTFWQIFLPLALFLIAWPIFAVGAVRWHRWMILGEYPQPFSFNHLSKSWSYFGRTAQLGLIGMPFLVFAGAISFVGLIGADTDELRHPQAAAYTWLVWYLLSAMIDIAVVVFMARFVLRLPRIAVLDKSPASQTQKFRPHTGWKPTLLLATLPLTLATSTLALLQAPAGGTQDVIIATRFSLITALQTLGSDLLYFYSALVFISVLSLWYAQHERSDAATTAEPQPTLA